MKITPIIPILSLVVLLLTGVSTVHAQSVELLLKAVQERKVALVQRDTISADLKRQADTEASGNTSTPTNPIETSELIQWGHSLDPYPTAQQIEGLGMLQLLEVLNKASREVDQMKGEYVNFDLQGSILVDENESLNGLPSVGDFTQDNFRSQILKLASLVEQLRVLNWPMVYQAKTLNSKVHKTYDPESPPPAPAFNPAIPFVENGGSEAEYYIDTDMPWVERTATVFRWDGGGGGYTTSVDAKSIVGALTAVRSVVAPETTQTCQIGNGRLVFLKRMLQDPYYFVDKVYPGNEAALPFNHWKRVKSEEDSFEVGTFAAYGTTTSSLGALSTAESAVRLEWGIPALSWSGEWQHESGYRFFRFSDSPDSHYEGGGGNSYNFPDSFSISLRCVCAPTFTPMEGAATRALMASGAGSGTVATPVDRDLVRIDLGRGLKDRFQRAFLGSRLDGFGNPVLTGSANAFRILYKTEPDDFPACLVEDKFAYDRENEEFTAEQTEQTGWYTKAEYISAWYKPRVSQIYGSDIVVEIVHGNDYSKTLNFYWASEVPVPADNVTEPPPITATAFKSVVLKNATVSGAAFPTAANKLRVQDGTLHSEVEKSSSSLYVVRTGSSPGGADFHTRTIEVLGPQVIKETLQEDTVSTVVQTEYYTWMVDESPQAYFDRFKPVPVPTKVTQGTREVVYTADAYAAPMGPYGYPHYSTAYRPMLRSATYSGTGWDMNGAETLWTAEGALQSLTRTVQGKEIEQSYAWSGRICTIEYKLDTNTYRTDTVEHSDTLDEETVTTAGSITTLKYDVPSGTAPWTLKRVESPGGYVATYNITPGVESTVIQKLEGWGSGYDAGAQTLTTLNRGGGLVSEVTNTLSGGVVLSSWTGSEHEPWGAPHKVTGLRNEVQEYNWVTTGQHAGQPLTTKTPSNITSGVTGYDILGRPSAMNTGFATYTPSYTNALRLEVQTPDGKITSNINEFGDALDFKDERGPGLELGLQPNAGYKKVDGRQVDVDINAVGEVLGVKSGLGARGARSEISAELPPGGSQRLLCSTTYARTQTDADAYPIKSYYDGKGRLVARLTPNANWSGGTLGGTNSVTESWVYNDAGRSVTYSPGPGPVLKARTQTLTNTADSVIMTVTEGGVPLSRTTRKAESGKLVVSEEINDDSGGGGAFWTQISRTETTPSTGVTISQPWDLTAAKVTSTTSVPAATATTVANGGGTDDSQSVTYTNGRVSRIVGRRAGTEFDLNNWVYQNERLTSVGGSIGGRSMGLEINAKGQVSRVFGPGFDKAYVLSGLSGFEFTESDSVQGTTKVVKASAVGDGTEVSGDVSEPKNASTTDLANGQTQTQVNSNLTVTQALTGAVKNKVYTGGSMSSTTNTFSPENLLQTSSTGDEGVENDFSQYGSGNKISSYYEGAGTVETEFYHTGPRKSVSAPNDERYFTSLRGIGSTVVHGAGSVWPGGSTAYSQDNKGNRSGTTVAVAGSGGYSETRSVNPSGLPYIVSSGSFSATYGYNNTTGELETITRGILTTTVGRDALGRITGYSTANSSGQSYAYGSGYNARNLRTSRTASHGVSWTGLEYDSRSQLTDAHLSDGTVLDFAYDSRNNRDSGGGPVTFSNNGVDQVTGRVIAQRGYGVRGRVAPGSVVRVFHPQAGAEGEEITADATTGVYAAYWTASGSFGSGVTRVELLVRGTLAGAGTGGTDAVADQKIWAVLPASSE
ncbi:hypothetical protein, partial [Verrucomicrobium sp. BvORR034]|uniref:RHS repeat domain-containing protein n=1 Tax=Verrucomicrobium sp. BvORR034 TaxID=1396418 RepID=UPI0009DD0C34